MTSLYSADMKVFMTLVVRDKADILEQNITYHLGQGVTHIIVVDNRSEDETPAILASFKARGVLTSTIDPDNAQAGM